MKQHVFYRGESKLHESLTPKILRFASGDKNHADMYLEETLYQQYLEIRFINNGVGKTKLADLSHQDRLEYLAKLQHYGFPTRLIDVTRSEKIAEYFACSLDENIMQDGRVYIFTVEHDYLNNHKSRQIQDMLDLIFDYRKVHDKQTKLSGNELGAFKRSLGKPVFVESIITDKSDVKYNLRIERQQGAFILMNNVLERSSAGNVRITEQINSNYIHTNIFQRIIGFELKIDKLVCLALQGDNKVNLFPDLDSSIEIEKEISTLYAYKRNLSNIDLNLDLYMTDAIDLVKIDPYLYKDDTEWHSFIEKYNQTLLDIFNLIMKKSSLEVFKNVLKFLKGDVEPYLSLYKKDRDLASPLSILKSIKRYFKSL